MKNSLLSLLSEEDAEGVYKDLSSGRCFYVKVTITDQSTTVERVPPKRVRAKHKPLAEARPDYTLKAGKA